MTSSPTSIFGYTDYREFLKTRYEEEKTLNRSFSHRHIMTKVGATSSGWFSDVLKGRISLTRAFALRLVKLFQLTAEEEDYFLALVDYGEAASSEERQRALEHILSFRELKVDLLGQDKFEYYARWYHAALRELLFIYPFRGDYEALAARLSPPITEGQARRAMDLLVRLGLVALDEGGRYRPTATILKKDSSTKSDHLANFLRANFELGIESLERFPKEMRDVSALTLALSPEDFLAAREEIRALRKKLLALSEKPHPEKKVYQCNFQVFPVTR